MLGSIGNCLAKDRMRETTTAASRFSHGSHHVVPGATNVSDAIDWSSYQGGIPSIYIHRRLLAAACLNERFAMQTTSHILANNLGFPRIGPKRELKHAVEGYWKGTLNSGQLLDQARQIRKENWQRQQAAGIDLIPSNDFSFYDHMLDACALLGAVPDRFEWDGGTVDLETYFVMARGHPDRPEATPMEMTKWFDTNYHYLVPELHEGSEFKLSSNKPIDEFLEARDLGIETKPVLVGPITFLALGKSVSNNSDFNRLELLDAILPVYEQVLRQLSEQGASWIQLDEPILVTDLSQPWLEAVEQAYQRLGKAKGQTRLLLATYFGQLRDNLDSVAQLPIDALHWDATRAAAEMDSLLEKLPGHMTLSMGVVDGRNIWRNDYQQSLQLLEKGKLKVGTERLMIATSCSLLHVPVSLQPEKHLDPELLSWLAFADEKLVELEALAKLTAGSGDNSLLYDNQRILQRRRTSDRIHNKSVIERLDAISEEDAQRKTPFAQRRKKQQETLNLPLLPTTTIGSFPQTAEVRQARAKYRRGDLSSEKYQQFLEEVTRKCVQTQEEIGLDVLAHGEFERTDMVEYFGQQLKGFAFTENGWVQSYGSRCVKPPFIYGDVSRPNAMTVKWIEFAKSLTQKPMKGMLTGPVTILQWSFVRDDQPRSQTAHQIALAIRDEVADLENAGIPIIQIDEPALREGLPLRNSEWKGYLQWAVKAFRLASSGVKDETQIHTHMCYADFNDIIDAIAELDADVISVEASRSRMELLKAFTDFRYPNDIGPGIWDIHSPRVPTVEEMAGLLRQAAKVIPKEHLWVNPDCGLKTRRWEEVIPALENLVVSARQCRQS